MTSVVTVYYTHMHIAYRFDTFTCSSCESVSVCLVRPAILSQKDAKLFAWIISIVRKTKIKSNLSKFCLMVLHTVALSYVQYTSRDYAKHFFKAQNLENYLLVPTVYSNFSIDRSIDNHMFMANL